MFVSRWKIETKQNPNLNMAEAIEFIPKKDETMVGGDQGGNHNMRLMPDTIQRQNR
jgi:hypothetical protein